MAFVLRGGRIWDGTGEHAREGSLGVDGRIAGLDGRLLPFGWLQLLWRLKVRGVRSGRMPLMGIAKRLQGTPKGAALALGMIDRIHARYSALGYDHGELSWILEDNRAVQAVIAATGAVPYKRYRIYAKALA